jgi:terminal uridylyltransferase
MYTKKMAIEDPFSLKQSLSRNLLTQTNKYIINVISKSCLYFVLNTHCIIENLQMEPNIKEEKYKIVEKLIAETGILDARKTNGLLEEDHDDQDEDENDIENMENGDESFLQTGDSVEEDENDDLFYFNNKTKPYKNKKTRKISTKKTNTLENIDNLTKEIDSLLKVKSLPNENLEKCNAKNSLSLEMESLSSITHLQCNESEDLDLDDEEGELGNDSENNDEDITEEEEETDIDENHSTTDVESENNEDLFFKLDSLETKTEYEHTNLLNKYSTNEYETAARSCISYILKRVVETSETFYEQMPNVTVTLLVETKENLREQAKKNFKFTASTLGFPKSPPLICSLCNKDGHLQSDCPQDRLPTLEELPKMTDKWREVLDRICHCIMSNLINF